MPATTQALEGSALVVNLSCSTDGDGLWSDRAADVRITRLLISYVASHDDDDDDDMPTFGELQVEFDINTWNPRDHGLIYTDRCFEAEFREALQKLGFSKMAADNVGYSEQGMQGDDYVSMDVGMVFLAEAKTIFRS